VASLIERNGRFCVVYSYETATGEKKQKWETYKTKADAIRRKSEVDYQKELGNVVIPACETMNDLLKEYISMYGKNVWALSTYRTNVHMISNYVLPHLGSVKLNDVTARVLEKYYQTLLKTEAVPRCTDKKYSKEINLITPETVRRIHKLLHSCFEQALRWDLIMRNPASYATVPKSTKKERGIWTAETLMKALDFCEDPKLRLAINLAFACSLRIGELLGLTWSCVDISQESIKNGVAYVYINKELQRVDRKVLQDLERKDVIFTFPVLSEKNKSQLVLKKPKTLTSIRKIFLPKTVAEMLGEWKKQQDEIKEELGSEYTDYDLVFPESYGTPTEASQINRAFKQLIEDNGLPKVVFHSIRHSSITYKLKLSGGDIKAVQGDSGHAQAKMVTDQYSHIIDENRKTNAQLVEEAFYSGRELSEHEKSEEESEKASKTEAKAPAVDPQLIAKLLSDPKMAALLQTLAQSIS